MTACHFVRVVGEPRAVCGAVAKDTLALVFGDLGLWRDFPGVRCASCVRITNSAAAQAGRIVTAMNRDGYVEDTLAELSLSKRCVCGARADTELDTCGDRECALFLLGFGELELVRGDSGWRHYLHGEAVHCGQGLILAAHVEGEEPEPIGALESRFANGRRKLAARVRYEAPLTQREAPPALLHTEVLGHVAVIRAHSGMRLRWPHRSRP